jgi:hypothetical protein
MPAERLSVALSKAGSNAIQSLNRLPFSGGGDVETIHAKQQTKCDSGQVVRLLVD